jgi:hypothetical protein
MMNELFDKHGLKDSRLSFEHLNPFLDVGYYACPRPSVWRLWQLLALDNTSNIPWQLHGAANDYGLAVSMYRWKTKLPEVYRQVFARGDPMKLHAARLRGETLEYVASVVPNINPIVALILKSLPTQ